MRRRRRDAPFEGPSVPGIVTSFLSAPATDRDVDYEHDYRERDDQRTDRRDGVPELPPEAFGVGVVAPRHPLEAEDVHRGERHVEADEHEREVQLAQAVGKESPEHLRPPVVEGGEEAENRTAEQNVMEVGD